MQINYHFALTKIQKLQNLKKKKKTFFFVPAGIAEIGQYSRYFFRYETGGLYVPVCLSVRYIPTVPTGTVWNWLP